MIASLAWLLTVLLALGFPHGDEFGESLVLVTCHSAVSTAFQRQVELEVRVQVIFQCLVPDESHATYTTVILHPFEDLHLRENGWSNRK